MTDLLKSMSVNDLKNAIWQIKRCGTVAVGGYPLEWYEDELYYRTGSKAGYHED